MLDKLSSWLGYVETFEKTWIINDESTVEKELTEIEWNF